MNNFARRGTGLVLSALVVVVTTGIARAQPPIEPARESGNDVPAREGGPAETPPTTPTRVARADTTATRPQRPFTRRTPMARTPNMFGDLFGGGSGSIGGGGTITSFVVQPGVTNGLGGTATFVDAEIVQFDPTIVAQHPGQNFAGQLNIGVPGLVAVNGINGVLVLVDAQGPVPPPPTVVFNATPQELADVTAALNGLGFDAALNTAVQGAELAATPNATVLQSGFVVLNPAQMSGDPLGSLNNVDLIFPLVVQTLVSVPTTTPFQFRFPIPSPSTGGAVVGRQKVAENASPLPRDRVFVDYSYFDNVPIAGLGVNVNRVAPGFEKTLFDRQASIRLRMPMATTLSSTIDLDGSTDQDRYELGNLFLDYKHLISSSDTHGLSAGLGVALPTADDLDVRLFGREFLRARNESVHLLPYIAGIATLQDGWFVQGFVQFDFDTNGNPVFIDGTGNGLALAGRAQDPAYLFLDAAVGRWLYERPEADGWFNGLVGTFELHYNRSLQRGDVVQLGSLAVGDFSEDVELLNAVVGATAMLGESTTLGVAFVTPLGGGADQNFDGEARILFNHYFGPGRPPARSIR